MISELPASLSPYQPGKTVQLYRPAKMPRMASIWSGENASVAVKRAPSYIRLQWWGEMARLEMGIPN
jgi:hypothetical protein